jgi:hypothetical protein
MAVCGGHHSLGEFIMFTTRQDRMIWKAALLAFKILRGPRQAHPAWIDPAGVERDHR